MWISPQVEPAEGAFFGPFLHLAPGSRIILLNYSEIMAYFVNSTLLKAPSGI
jgi:hypothetical protein